MAKRADDRSLAEADPVMAALIERVGPMDMERRRRGDEQQQQCEDEPAHTTSVTRDC